MKNKIWIFIILAAIILIGIGTYFYFSNNNNPNSNYEASKTSTNESNENSTNSEQSKDSQNNVAGSDSQNEKPKTEEAKEPQQEAQKQPQYKEEQIATFSTKIYSSDKSRQNNIKITCNTLNNTTVKNGSTFSFCSTVGMATTSKGYQKADIYDNKGNKKKGLGGGNCQVSTTLYNAVLNVQSLAVTERHEHSNNVPYVKKGKDAAVAYGSYDFKFKNNTGNDIKIKSSTDGKSVTTTIFSVKEV